MSKPVPRLVALAASGLITVSTLQPAFAFSDVFALTKFTIGCAGLMVSDPEKHVEVCNPAMPGPRLDTLASGSMGGAPAAPPPAPPAPPAPPEPSVVPEPPEECFTGASLGRGQAVMVVAAALQLAEVVDCPEQT